MDLGDNPTARGTTLTAPRSTEPAPRASHPRPLPTRVSPSAAAIARPLIVVLPVLAFLVPSLFVAFTRQPVYTSEAQLLVAGFDVQTAAIPGFVDASRTLAGTYARLVATDTIVTPVAASLNVSKSSVAGKISATATPDAALIRVDGKGSSPKEAQRYASAAAQALVQYSSRISGNDNGQLRRDYQAAAQALATAQLRQDQADAAVRTADAASLPAARQALAQARADVAAAQLDANRAGQRYSNGGSGGSGVQLVGPADSATSDKKSKIELAIIGPILLGIVVGIALATVVVNRQVAAAGRGKESLPGR